MVNGLQIAERFAKALDKEDYAIVESLIDDECNYLCRGERHHGPSEIVASYRGHGDAAEPFDQVDYESDVVAEPNGRFRIRFADYLTHAGRRMTFRCEQIIEINDAGEIIRIEHFDLPGQTEALAEFRNLLVDRKPEIG